MSEELVKITTDEERLTVLERGTALLVHARDAVDCKRVADWARAAEVYARAQHVSEEAIAAATALKTDALAQMGEFLRSADMNKGEKGRFSPTNTGGYRGEPPVAPPTLADSGISKRESMTAQAVTTIREENPKLYAELRAGKISIQKARKELVAPVPASDAETAVAPESAPAEPDPLAEFVGRINRLCVALDALKKTAAELVATPNYGRHLHGDSVMAAIESVRQTLWQSRPTETCTCARNTPDGSFAPNCRACFGSGVCPANRVRNK